jgi:hypothetical protein
MEMGNTPDENLEESSSQTVASYSQPNQPSIKHIFILLERQLLSGNAKLLDRLHTEK